MQKFDETIKEEIKSKMAKTPCCKNSFNLGSHQSGLFNGQCNNCLKFFLRGLYLNHGNSQIILSNDDIAESAGKGYLIEFELNSEEFAENLATLYAKNEIDVKVAFRQNKVLLYLTDFESIKFFLHLINCSKSLLILENESITRELRQKINREVNATENNIKKHVDATNRQIEEIKIIDKIIGLKSLPFSLQTICHARIENEELSLGELAEKLKIGKSALNHRLRKVCEIYKNLVK